MFTSDIYSSIERNQKEKFKAIQERIKFSLLSGSVLDIGCGTCIFETFLKDNEIDISSFFGIDPDKNMLSQNKSGIKTEQTYYEDFFSDKIFDAVVCMDTLHLLKDKDIIKFLKKDGLILVTMFFSSLEEKRRLVLSSLKECEVIQEFTIMSKEKEYVVLARKK